MIIKKLIIALCMVVNTTQAMYWGNDFEGSEDDLQWPLENDPWNVFQPLPRYLPSEVVDGSRKAFQCTPSEQGDFDSEEEHYPSEEDSSSQATSSNPIADSYKNMPFGGKFPHFMPRRRKVAATKAIAKIREHNSDTSGEHNFSSRAASSDATQQSKHIPFSRSTPLRAAAIKAIEKWRKQNGRSLTNPKKYRKRAKAKNQIR